MTYRLCRERLETNLQIGLVHYNLIEASRGSLSARVSVVGSDTQTGTHVNYSDGHLRFEEPNAFERRVKRRLTDLVKAHYQHDVLDIPRGSFREMVADFERLLFADVLDIYHTNDSAASHISMPRMTFKDHLRRLGKLEVALSGNDLEVRFPLTNYEASILASERAILSDALARNGYHARITAESLSLPLSTFKNHLSRVGIVLEKPVVDKSKKSLEDEIIRDFKRDHPVIYRVLEHEFRQKVVNAARAEDARITSEHFVKDGQIVFDPEEGERLRFDKEAGYVPLDND